MTPRMTLPLPRDKHDTQHALNGELTRFALMPMPGEVEEGVAEVARALLGISKDF